MGAREFLHLGGRLRILKLGAVSVTLDRRGWRKHPLAGGLLLLNEEILPATRVGDVIGFLLQLHLTAALSQFLICFFIVGRL